MRTSITVLMVLVLAIAGGASAFEQQFTSELSYHTLTQPYQIVLADLDGDDLDDIIVTNYDNYDSSFAVHFNYGDGTIGPAERYVVGQYLFSVAAADFDNDGVLEVAVSLRGENRIVIMENDGDGASE